MAKRAETFIEKGEEKFFKTGELTFPDPTVFSPFLIVIGCPSEMTMGLTSLKMAEQSSPGMTMFLVVSSSKVAETSHVAE